MHYTAYVDYPYRRVEVDADTYNEAEHRAAMLLDTRREHSIVLIECPQPCTIAELIADTEDTQ